MRLTRRALFALLSGFFVAQSVPHPKLRYLPPHDPIHIWSPPVIEYAMNTTGMTQDQIINTEAAFWRRIDVERALKGLRT